MTPSVALAREAIVLAGAGAAIALQVAHRQVAAGVHYHSAFTDDPIGRLQRTLQYIYAVSLPEAAHAQDTVARWVSGAHSPVHGTDATGRAYSADDPAGQLWVTSTLYWTAEEIRWRIWGENITPEAHQQIYDSYAVLGTALGMPADAWPVNRAEFYRLWDQMVADLEVTDYARGIMADLFAARKAPAWVRSLMPVVRWVTAGLLPADIRTQLGLDWSGADAVREDRLWRVLRTVYPTLPIAGIRDLPSRIIVATLPRGLDQRDDGGVPGGLNG